jgi:hypothetical protein
VIDQPRFVRSSRDPLGAERSSRASHRGLPSYLRSQVREADQEKMRSWRQWGVCQPRSAPPWRRSPTVRWDQARTEAFRTHRRRFSPRNRLSLLTSTTPIGLTRTHFLTRSCRALLLSVSPSPWSGRDCGIHVPRRSCKLSTSQVRYLDAWRLSVGRISPVVLNKGTGSFVPLRDPPGKDEAGHDPPIRRQTRR